MICRFTPPLAPLLRSSLLLSSLSAFSCGYEARDTQEQTLHAVHDAQHTLSLTKGDDGKLYFEACTASKSKCTPALKTISGKSVSFSEVEIAEFHHKQTETFSGLLNTRPVFKAWIPTVIAGGSGTGTAYAIKPKNLKLSPRQIELLAELGEQGIRSVAEAREVLTAREEFLKGFKASFTELPIPKQALFSPTSEFNPSIFKDEFVQNFAHAARFELSAHRVKATYALKNPHLFDVKSPNYIGIPFDQYLKGFVGGGEITAADIIKPVHLPYFNHYQRLSQTVSKWDGWGELSPAKHQLRLAESSLTRNVPSKRVLHKFQTPTLNPATDLLTQMSEYASDHGIPPIHDQLLESLDLNTRLQDAFPDKSMGRILSLPNGSVATRFLQSRLGKIVAVITASAGTFAATFGILNQIEQQNVVIQYPAILTTDEGDTSVPVNSSTMKVIERLADLLVQSGEPITEYCVPDFCFPTRW